MAFLVCEKHNWAFYYLLLLAFEGVFDRPRWKVAIAMSKILLNEREEGRFDRDDEKEGVQLIQEWIRIL